MSATHGTDGVPDYLRQPLGEFLDSVASGEPAPGGGAAAAIAVSLAAGLSAMAARLSGEYLTDAAELAGRAEELRSEVSPLARADAEAYGRALSALRLPGDDPDRGSAVERAFEEAADVPLAVAEAARDVAGIAARLCERGNPNLRGDALSAALLAEAAARSAAELVRINTGDGDERGARAGAACEGAAGHARRAETVVRS